MVDYEILSKRMLAKDVVELKVFAPLVARHCLAGQFVIVRTDIDGERVPFTICDFSREEGSVSLLIQTVGYTTDRLKDMSVGERLEDVVGPLGKPTELSEFKNICLVAGGIGIAVIYPQLKQLSFEGKRADVVVGARTKDLLIYSDEVKALANEATFVTDDGSNGKRGLVTDALSETLDKKQYDCVFAVGPLRMMQAVVRLASSRGIRTIVSMNSLMVDGTGMCGCCRVKVAGKVKYACIDGPEFDGSEIDFDEAIKRSKTYLEHEKNCRLKRYER